MIKKLSPIFIAWLVTSCAFPSTGTPFQDAPKPPGVPSEEALVYIYRYAEPANFYSVTDFFVGDQKIARLDRRQYTWFTIAPGKYTVMERLPWELRPLTGYEPVTLDIELQAGKTYFVGFELGVSNQRTEMEVSFVGGIPVAYPVTDADSKAALRSEEKSVAWEKIPQCEYVASLKN